MNIFDSVNSPHRQLEFVGMPRDVLKIFATKISERKKTLDFVQRCLEGKNVFVGYSSLGKKIMGPLPAKDRLDLFFKLWDRVKTRPGIADDADGAQEISVTAVAMSIRKARAARGLSIDGETTETCK